MVIYLIGKVKKIRADISKNYMTGQVRVPVTSSKSEVQSSTRAGLYVVRSLTGVANKLKDAVTNKETALILEKWLEKVVANTAIPNHSSIIQNLAKVLNTKLP